MPLFENMIMEGNDKADELAKCGPMMDEGEMPQIIACAVQQKREGLCGVAARS